MLKNNSYNIISVLSERSQGLELYEQYLEDAQEAGSQECVELWQQLQQQDQEAVEKLSQHVQMLVQNGKW